MLISVLLVLLYNQCYTSTVVRWLCLPIERPNWPCSPGGSVDKYGQIGEQILGRIAVSVVKGLKYLWSLKIMHRGEQHFTSLLGRPPVSQKEYQFTRKTKSLPGRLPAYQVDNPLAS